MKKFWRVKSKNHSIFYLLNDPFNIFQINLCNFKKNKRKYIILYSLRNMIGFCFRLQFIYLISFSFHQKKQIKKLRQKTNLSKTGKTLNVVIMCLKRPLFVINKDKITILKYFYIILIFLFFDFCFLQLYLTYRLNLFQH